MAEEYTNALADVTAAFSYGSTEMSPLDFRNKADGGFAVSGESFSVPASAPYIVQLDYKPLEQSSITINDGSNDLTLIRYGETPTTNQVGVDMETGLLQFHSDKASASITVDYTAHGSVILSHFMNRLQKEVIAVQAWINDDLLTDLESGIEAAIDTLPNLTSVQGQTIALSGALTVESASTVNQDLTSDASPTFDDLTLTGDLGVTGTSAFGGNCVLTKSTNGAIYYQAVNSSAGGFARAINWFSSDTSAAQLMACSSGYSQYGGGTWAGATVLLFDGGDFILADGTGSNLIVCNDGGGGIVVNDDVAINGALSVTSNVDFSGLPTSDPTVSGRLWNDSGTLKISAG